MSNLIDGKAEAGLGPKSSRWYLWFAGAFFLCVVALIIYFFTGSAISGNREDAKSAESVAQLKALDEKLAEQNKVIAKQEALLAHIDGKDAAAIRKIVIPETQKQLASGEYHSALISLAKLWSGDLSRPDVWALVDKAAKETRKDRIDFARTYEDDHLKAGDDYKVAATGPDNTTLEITYPLMYHPTVYKIENDNELNIKLRELGFRKVQLRDGVRKWWSYIPIANRYP
jgi:hypothetical protein